MTCWEIIGISPTVDKRAIKHAYASKLKKHRPDEDPEGFKQLRIAYEEALEEAKYYQPEQDITAPQAASEYNSDEVTPQTQPDTHSQGGAGGLNCGNSEEAVAKLEQAVFELYSDFNARIQLANWQAIFDSYESWSMEVRQHMTPWLLQFIAQYRFIPCEIIDYLDNKFAWHDNFAWLQRVFKEDFLRYILNRTITCRWGLSYEGIRFPENTDIQTIETYLDQREHLENLLDNPEDSDRGTVLAALQEQAIDDPERYRLLSTLHLNEGDQSLALQYSQQLNNAFNENIDGHLRSAALYYQQSHFSAAFNAYESALAIDEDHPLALKGLAACYLQIHDLLASKHLYDQVLVQTPFDMEARIQLVRINQQIVQRGLEHLDKNPKDRQEQRRVAESYLEIGAYHEAIQFLLPLTAKGFFSRTDRDGEFHYLLGLAYEAIGEVDAAENAFNLSHNRSVKSGGNGYEALVKLGEQALCNKKFDWSVKLLKKAVRYNPRSARVLLLLADAQRCLEQADEALETINQAIALNSEETLCYTVRAELFIGAENYAEAAADLKRVLKASPTDCKNWHKLGNCQQQLGLLDEAMDSFENSTAYNTAREDSAILWLQIACKTKNRERATQALEALERADADPAQVNTFREAIERMSSEVVNEFST
ncbi:tetratricopeptide repeat protein [Microbulbifer sp. SSSA002]|uniref:tetratricopeptide repeat protein n=1 Tax=Microbulbifer sp. SSSA002 TaxID=3243376 RepID=UPI004039C74C